MSECRGRLPRLPGGLRGMATVQRRAADNRMAGDACIAPAGIRARNAVTPKLHVSPPPALWCPRISPGGRRGVRHNTDGAVRFSAQCGDTMPVPHSQHPENHVTVFRSGVPVFLGYAAV